MMSLFETIELCVVLGIVVSVFLGSIGFFIINVLKERKEN